MTPERGTIVAGKYRVDGPLGSGGMGRLVKAEHLLMKKPVAIKFLGAEGSAKRLIREARAAQALESEHVVRVFDLGIHEDAPYIVMELLEGADLSTHIPMPLEPAIDAIAEACVAVAEAHVKGIFHRDLKPANLFATKTIVKVLDFGISRVPHGLADEDCEATSSDAMLGTPHYMSPEQLRNPANVDGRTDIWALAVTLCRLVTGTHPFPGANRREVMAAVLTDPPIVPDSPVRDVILAALEKRPADRTPTVHAFANALLPFASKRGRLAIEKVATIAEVRIATDESDAVAPRSEESLPPTEADAERSRRRPRWHHGVWLLLPAAIAAGLVVTTSRRAPVSSPPATTSRPAPPPPPPESTPSEARQERAPLMITTTSTIASASTPAVQPPPSRPRVPAAAVPSTSATTTTTTTSTRAHDVDGVPIVE